MMDWNITELAESLTHEETMYLLLLQDPNGAMIPLTRLSYYVKEGMRIGEEAAEHILGEMDDASIASRPSFWKKEFERLGNVALCYDESSEEEGVNPMIAASTVSGGDGIKVTIHPNALLEKQDAVRACTDLPEWEPGRMLSLHMAHEYFHCLEFGEIGRVYEKMEPVTGTWLMRFRKYPIRSVSEIAAHSFANRLIRPELPPVAMDLITMMKRGELNMDVFLRQVERVRTVMRPPVFA